MMKFLTLFGRCSIMLLALVVVVVCVAGCAATEKMAESLAEKDVAGSGFISIQRIGVDPETKIPALKSTVVSGDFQTIKSGSNYINYRNEESSAWYNAENRTRRQSLTITADGDTDMAELLRRACNMIDKDAMTRTGSQAASEAAAPATSE